MGGGGNGSCCNWGGCWMVGIFFGGGGWQWLVVGVVVSVGLLG